MIEVYEVYYYDYLIGNIRVDWTVNRLLYKTNSEVFGKLDNQFILNALKEDFDGNINDMPFFESRINNMKKFSISKLKYETDNILLKKVE